MDFHSSVEQLDRAAQILLAGPNQVSKDERLAAESVISAFRETRNCFSLCKYILENCKNELILFETADVMRNNLLQDWSKIPTEELQSINQHLIQLLFQNTEGLHYSYSVIRRLASVIALIVKHESFTNEGQSRKDFVHRLVSYFNTSGKPLIISCILIDGLLGEHQFAVNTSDISLTYEMHFAAKKMFENQELKQIFSSCLHYLRNYNEHNVERARDLDYILKLLESIFYWNFTKNNLPKRVLAIIETEATPTFKPPTSWTEIINDEAFVQIFFETHLKIRMDEAFLLRTLNLMIQLMTMHGPIVDTKDARLKFLSKILPPFTSLLQVQAKIAPEVFGLSDLIRKVLLFHRTSTLTALPPQILENFLKAVGTFTCQVIQQSALEESRAVIEDRLYRDSLTKLLEAWMNLLIDSENAPRDLIHPIATQIFNTYLQSNISPPEGFRQPLESADESICDEEEEKDKNQFRDQLQAIGVIGRFILSHSIPLITNLLNYKCQTYQNQIVAVSSAASINKEILDSLHEDLHWIILIAGHIIAFDAIGETNLVPPEINEFSISSNGNVENSSQAIEKSLQLIPVEQDNSIIDPIIKLVCSILSLSEIERRVINSNLTQFLSTEVASNILWFLQRWAESYFIPNEEYYAAHSPCFISAWGDASPRSIIVQNALLRKIHEDLLKFNGETDVMTESINLLLSLVNSDKKSELAIQSSDLGPLVLLANQIGPGKYNMPNLMYRNFVKAIISVGSYCKNEVHRNQYWDQIIGPLLNRFLNFVTLTSAERHRDDVRLELSCILSGFIGAAMSSQSRVASAIFTKMSNVVQQAGAIIDTYHNYIDIVELCLELVTEVAKRSLSYLSRPESFLLYESAMKVVNSYTNHSSGRKTIEKNAEEETFNDLLLLMEMLTCLLTKDFLDLSPEAISQANAESPKVTASEVSLQGLCTVLPLMNTDLLQYPNFSSKYFRLVAFLSELHPNKIMILPPMMVQSIYDSVRIGIQGTTAESFSSCCEFIACMGIYISKNSLQSEHTSELCKPFLKIFLEMILSQKVGKDSIAPIASVLFALISAFNETFQELANQLIASRKSEESRLKMHDAFLKLTAGLNLIKGGDRLSRIQFRERIDSFIFSAKGCLD